MERVAEVSVIGKWIERMHGGEIQHSTVAPSRHGAMFDCVDAAKSRAISVEAL
jgi:hypothetical protein